MAEKRSKQRKKLEEKLEEILPLAEVKIMAKGMVGFSPNEIIDDCSLSRATYYKVAPNATTIYILLGIKGVNAIINMVSKIENSTLPAREKIAAFLTAKKILKDTHPVLFESVVLAQLEIVRKDNSIEHIELFDSRLQALDKFVSNQLNEAMGEGQLNEISQTNNVYFRETLLQEFIFNSSLSYANQIERLNSLLPWKQEQVKSNKAMIDKIMASIFKDESIILSQLH